MEQAYGLLKGEGSGTLPQVLSSIAPGYQMVRDFNSRLFTNDDLWLKANLKAIVHFPT
jgi:hypothetical protein